MVHAMQHDPEMGLQRTRQLPIFVVTIPTIDRDNNKTEGV